MGRRILKARRDDDRRLRKQRARNGFALVTGYNPTKKARFEVGIGTNIGGTAARHYKVSAFCSRTYARGERCQRLWMTFLPDQKHRQSIPVERFLINANISSNPIKAKRPAATASVQNQQSFGSAISPRPDGCKASAVRHPKACRRAERRAPGRRGNIENTRSRLIFRSRRLPSG